MRLPDRIPAHTRLRAPSLGGNGSPIEAGVAPDALARQIYTEQVHWLERIVPAPPCAGAASARSVLSAAAASAHRVLCWRIAEAFAGFCAQGTWREALALFDDSYERGLRGMDLPSVPVVPAVLVGVWPCVPAADQRDLLIAWWPRLTYTWPGRDALVAMLRAAGYLGPTARPCPPRALYRGVVDPAHARGLSWTDGLKVARSFSQRFGGRPQAVFRATLRSADALLGYFPQCHEREYVVDPAGLAIVERVRRRPPVHRQPPLPLRPPGVPSRRRAGRDG